MREMMIGVMICLAAGVIQAAETPVASAETSGQRVILYEKDFETGKGLVGEGPYKGSWESNYKEAALCIEKPRGQGNDSQFALTCHAKKSMEYTTCEMAYSATVEPDGWDGSLSFSFYNGGFTEMYAMYMPALPADTTSHRAYFSAPTNQWVKLDLPLDKFLYCGHRPRRGAPLERIVFAGVGPQHDDTVFQVDDIKLYRVKQANPLKPKPKAPLPEGVLFRQDFNDPGDFTVESKFFVITPYCFCWRVAGGVEASGKPADRTADPDAGCLRIESFGKNQNLRSALLFDVPGNNTVIEFDVFCKGVFDLGLSANGTTLRKGRYRIYVQPQPEDGKWTHYQVSAEELTPFGMDLKEGREEKTGKGETFNRVGFLAASKDREERYMLIDNLVIRQEKAAPVKAAGTTEAPKDNK